MSTAAIDKDVAGPDLPGDYGTPAYEARWIRKKLNLPADAKTGVVQGAMHVQESHAHGYEAYITAYRCDDKQGEIARQSVTIEEQAAEIAVLRARLGRFDSMKIQRLEAENLNLKTALHCGLGQDKYRDGDVDFALERCPAYAALEAKLVESDKDAAKWRAVCVDWEEDEEDGLYTWQGYAISQWTGEAWGPHGFRHDSGDCMEAKAACLEHFKTHGVS